MKTRIVFICLLVSCCTFLRAQSFTGTVVDEQNQPISNVSVFTQHDSLLTKTDENGVFFLQKLQRKLAFKLEKFGYESLNGTAISGENQRFTLKERMMQLDPVEVRATRAQANTPTTFKQVNKEQIQAANFGQDVPYLIANTPSSVTTSDAGTGIGYTGIRIRGVDPTAINVTVDGIPINDAESHGLYWVNMPDLVSTMQSIQIQRGVGTSSNGGAAFGASINVETDKVGAKPFANIDNSYGSFNTWKNTLQFGTGLINHRFAFEGRLSNVTSDGYVDRASSNLKSFFTSGTWLIDRKSTLRFNIFGGKEITYQAWNGIPESRLRNDVAGMMAYATRNGLSPEETSNLLNSGRTYNYFTYKNQVDHYEQTHYQLHFNHRFNDFLKLNVSAHLTRGKGYYEEYKYAQSLTDYNIEPVILNNDTVSSSDLIRRKSLDNYFYGIVYNLAYKKNNLEITYGGGINRYTGSHIGTVIWSRFASNSEIDHQYYNDKSAKIDFNNYLKVNYRIKNEVIFADAQIRVINYVIDGLSDVAFAPITEKIINNYVFFNPKIGWMHRWENNDLYASIGVAHREPIREDFAVGASDYQPKPEELYDFELGNRFHKGKWDFSVDYYMMYYRNQLILTGKVNNVGAYVRMNVPQSYRTGLEADASFQATKWFRVAANAAYSWNKLVEFTEYLDDYDNGTQVATTYKNSDLAFSPAFVGGLQLNFTPLKDFHINLIGKYVSRQYLDNSQSKSRSLDGYFVTNFDISYLWRLPVIEGIEFGFQINNLLNAKYVNNGYTYGYISNQEAVHENFYFPQAGINFMGRIRIRI